jgi:hypothetical protein
MTPLEWETRHLENYLRLFDRDLLSVPEAVQGVILHVIEFDDPPVLWAALPERLREIVRESIVQVGPNNLQAAGMIGNDSRKNKRRGRRSIAKSRRVCSRILLDRRSTEPRNRWASLRSTHPTGPEMRPSAAPLACHRASAPGGR